MEMSKRYLDMLPCDTLALRASPVEQEMADLLDDKMSNVLDLYKNMYYSFPPTLQETMFPDGWLPTMERGTPDNLHVDQHPLPIDYYNYLVKLGINVTDKEYAEESTRKAYLTNPDCSDWEVYFPDTAEIANKSMRIMF